MALFTPFRQRSLELRNRIVVSPMCQYSAEAGVPNEWHKVHLASRAVGGAALVMAEASAVSAEGRITPWDTGIWNEAQVEAWLGISRLVAQAGAVPGIQLAHAGRKASTDAPWRGGGVLPAADRNGWRPVAPSAVPFDPEDAAPLALDEAGLRRVVADFTEGARRALRAGFKVIELHAAHGYLLHEFLSPLSNHRADAYGGGFENRARLLLEVARSVRAVWPEALPLWARISATDWVEGGWDIEQSVELARRLRGLEVDLIDCSSGGLVPDARIPAGPGYQVGFAARIRREAGIATGAVGMIHSPEQAETIVASGQADVVLLAREMLRDPYFPRRAAAALHQKIAPPEQYGRAW